MSGSALLERGRQLFALLPALVMESHCACSASARFFRDIGRGQGALAVRWGLPQRCPPVPTANLRLGRDPLRARCRSWIARNPACLSEPGLVGTRTADRPSLVVGWQSRNQCRRRLLDRSFTDKAGTQSASGRDTLSDVSEGGRLAIGSTPMSSPPRVRLTGPDRTAPLQVSISRIVRVWKDRGIARASGLTVRCSISLTQLEAGV